MKVILMLVFLCAGYSAAYNVPYCGDADDVQPDIRVSVCVTRSTSLPSADLKSVRAACVAFNHHLCALTELYEAYNMGARNEAWALIDVDGRDARLGCCRSDYITRGECFGDKFLMNTPRPAAKTRAYCCKEQDSCQA